MAGTHSHVLENCVFCFRNSESLGVGKFQKKIGSFDTTSQVYSNFLTF